MTARMLGSLFSLALLVALPAAAQADGKVASATGVKQVNGQTVYVDVVVAVPTSQTARQATDQALAQQGARREKPPWAGGPGGPGGGGGGGGEQYFYTGLEWSSTVTQHYNPAGQRVSTAKTALTNTYSDWSNIQDSTYNITGGTDTTRCPSLVQQCTGPQVTDGFNDVGWASIGGSTLGVTWFVTSGDPEADMALNTRFTWKQTCGSSGGSGYDLETVFLHENGHVAGLDHANRTDSVMYPSYQAPQCALFSYDERSMANLY
jgi:hypothetical protein